MSRAEKQGVEAEQSHPAPGARPKLTAEQHRQLPDLLAHGAEAFGFRGQVWTTKRVATVIRRTFGVSYHPDHIGRLLRACGLSPQRPQRTAKDHRVRAWMQEEWPRVKELGRRRAWLICLDQTG